MLIRELIVAQPILQNLSAQKVPAKLAYALGKNFRLVNQELADFETARRKMLGENFELGEDNKYVIPPEREAEAQKMYNDLLDVETKFEPFKISLELFDGVELSTTEMMAIDFLLE